MKGVINISAAELNGTKKSRRARQKKKVEVEEAVQDVRPHPSHDAFPEEFDFNAGLLSFNKSAIFAGIQASDSTDPALRLHSHNRNDTHAQAQAKLLPNENVLSKEDLEDQGVAEEFVVRRQEEVRDAVVAEKEVVRGAAVQEEDVVRGAAVVEEAEYFVDAKQSIRKRGKKTRRNPKQGRFVNSEGVPIVEVRLKQYREIISIVDVRFPFPRVELRLKIGNVDRDRTQRAPTNGEQRSLTRFVPPLPTHFLLNALQAISTIDDKINLYPLRIRCRKGNHGIENGRSFIESRDRSESLYYHSFVLWG